MNALLFVITLITNNICIVYNSNDIDLSNYSQLITRVDVYDSSALDDNLADQLFPVIYNLDNLTIQCAEAL
jgi:hypothetical protein